MFAFSVIMPLIVEATVTGVHEKTRKKVIHVARESVPKFVTKLLAHGHTRMLYKTNHCTDYVVYRNSVRFR